MDCRITASRARSGFTLVEMMVVAAIFAVVAALGTVASFSLYRRHTLLAERDNVISVLSSARSSAMANADRTAHGVHFDETQYVLFRGSSYAARDAAYDQAFPLSGGLSASSTVADIIFSPLEATTAPATVSLSDGSKSLSISFNSEGRIQW